TASIHFSTRLPQKLLPNVTNFRQSQKSQMFHPTTGSLTKSLLWIMITTRYTTSACMELQSNPPAMTPLPLHKIINCKSVWEHSVANCEGRRRGGSDSLSLLRS